jgi:hypothetical protein
MEEMIFVSSVDSETARTYLACERVIVEAFAIASLLDFVNKGFPWLVQRHGLLSDLLDRNHLRRVPRQLSVLGAVHVAHIRGYGGVASNQIMIQEGGMMMLLA